MMKKHTRFEKKMDVLFWFLVSFLPLILYIVNVCNGAPTDFFTFVDVNFNFVFVSNIFNDVLNVSFGSVSPVSVLLSYFVSVELLHVLYDFFVLLPRLAHHLVNKVVDL